MNKIEHTIDIDQQFRNDILRFLGLNDTQIIVGAILIFGNK